ncbi:MAG: flagellar assembly protein FliW [Chloroflexi bacterium]|nr:flagellar assembly protein FliW [Chloroflexota bacterium]
MNTAEIVEPELAAEQNEMTIRLPLGLLGFEGIKKYVLLSRPEDEPFHWLQMLEDDNLAFLVVSPFAVVSDYQPDIPDEDAVYLGLESPEDALVLNIVTLRGKQSATINLKGPIVINRHTLIGKQVILANAADYTLRHPLSLAEQPY